MSSLALSFPAPWPQSCYSFPDADGSASHSSHSLQPALRRSSLLLSLMLLTGQLVQVSDSRQVQVLLFFLAPPLKRTRHVPARSQASLIADSLHGGSHFLPSVVRVFVFCSAIHATLSSCDCPFRYFTFEQITPSAGPAGRRATPGPGLGHSRLDTVCGVRCAPVRCDRSTYLIFRLVPPSSSERMHS